MEEALIEGHTIVAAVGLVPPIKDYIETEAENLAKEWLTKYQLEIKSFSDERQDIYRQIREMSADPLDVDLARPSMWMQPTTVLGADGIEKELPSFGDHLLCDEDGLFPEDFNGWEEEVVSAELKREGTIGWYRNPSRASQDSLGVIYEEGTETKIVRPDFIFFTQLPDGSIVADIVDPHGTHLSDAIPKLKGLAQYAETHSKVFRRVDAIAKIGDNYRVLDLTEKSVREEIQKTVSAKDLYVSNIASDYSV